MCQTKQLVADHTAVTTQSSSAQHGTGWLVGWLVVNKLVKCLFDSVYFSLTSRRQSLKEGRVESPNFKLAESVFIDKVST